MQLFIYTALILGIGGSLHCLGMCGPLMLGLPFNAMPGNKKWSSVFLYFLFKALGYGCVGLLFGLLGNGIKLFFWQQALSIFSGVVLLLIVCFPLVKNKIPQNNYFNSLLNKIYGKILTQNRPYKFLVLGFLNALLPCGLVYTALVVAASLGNAINGFLFMFTFGIGTSPLLIVTILLGYKVNFKYKKYIKNIAFIFSLILGVILILRGLNLGMPYISPSVIPSSGEVNCCKP